jgi:D-alanyl-D-alanine carboxypeptidase/D-alanyl-D-alanine-endopeptidase (penicillin-binding protein 4)
VLLVMLGLLLLMASFVAVAGTRQFRADRAFHPIRVPSATAPATAVAGVLGSAGSAPSSSAPAAAQAPIPSAAGVAAALADKLTAADLGPSVSAQVYDAATGAALFGHRAGVLVGPASTAKLLTAAAILTVHKATDRFTTKVVAGAVPGTVVLVGGGDPTLSGAPAGQATEYAEAGRISDLAAQVRKSLGSTPITQVMVDDSLFTGPNTGPGWAAEDTPSSYACVITAALVDAGRDTPDAALRSAQPDLAAGNALATALAGAAVSRGTAPAGAKVLGQVQSAPVGVIVEQMLRDTDNVMADVLGRQIAIAAKQPASFTGEVAAIGSVLAPLGVTVGTGLRDGSGLSAQNRIPATALTQVLLKVVDPKHPELRSILTGMPVAGWEGSLVEQNRFTGLTSGADGVVRAKTGSLTGVSSMAGILTDVDGRQLIFAFVADQAPTEGPTRAAIDRLVYALTRCGCR